MHDTQSLLAIILESIFIGFGLLIPIISLIRTSDLRNIQIKELFILTGVQMVRLAGLLYFTLWAIDLSKSRITGPYWWAYIFTPGLYLILSQFFWIKKSYMKKAALITLALMLLVMPSLGQNYERFVILTTSLHRDYLPSGWDGDTLIWGYIASVTLEYVLNIIVFAFINFAVIFASGRLKKK